MATHPSFLSNGGALQGSFVLVPNGGTRTGDGANSAFLAGLAIGLCGAIFRSRHKRKNPNVNQAAIEYRDISGQWCRCHGDSEAILRKCCPRHCEARRRQILKWVVQELGDHFPGNRRAAGCMRR